MRAKTLRKQGQEYTDKFLNPDHIRVGQAGNEYMLKGRTGGRFEEFDEEKTKSFDCMINVVVERSNSNHNIL